MNESDLVALLGQPFDAVRTLFPEWRFTKEDDLGDLPDRVYYSSKSNGLQLLVDATSNAVQTIFAYPATYPHAVAGVGWDWSREQILERLGNPTISGPAERSPLLGLTGAWDRYDRSTHCLHIQYSTSTPRVEMVTLMTPRAAPRPD